MKRRALILLSLILIMFAGLSWAIPANTDVERLEELADELRVRLEASRNTPLFWEMKAREAETRSFDSGIELVGLDSWGRPIYYSVNNLNAAKSIRTVDLWPGGAAGFNLSGTGLPAGALGLWDAGGVRPTHQELAGRVTQVDAPGATHPHSTHVAGTLIASGVDPDAKGMAHGGSLSAWDWNYDASEMAAAAAAGLWISNHSYGTVTGWQYGLYGDEYWYWLGNPDIDAHEDWGFGFYVPDWPGWNSALVWDEIAHSAPHYTIVKSAGNDRDDDIPVHGDGHYSWNYDTGEWVWSTNVRDPDGGDTGFDTITDTGNAKNVITVGAVEDLPFGWSQPSDVLVTQFSSWGPTDDGRIKPDLVANGRGLRSCIDSYDDAYASYSGTSMSAPNLAGSVALLYEQFNSAKGTPPLASTIKALLIHTADEAGPFPGPDYMHGWGLANLREAAGLIDLDTRVVDSIREDQIAQGETKIYTFHTNGMESQMVTLVWTDPPGPGAPYELDPPDLMLVNDLDLRMIHGWETYYPWVLDPASPSNYATQGDNFRDNVERVQATGLAGDVTIEITHKGTLSAPQAYSLVFTGFDGTAVAVTDFDLEGSPGRVDLRWEAPGAAAAQMQLLGEGGGREWPVPFREIRPGIFSAVDLEMALAAGGLFHYEIQEREADGAWTTLRGESILLDALPLRTELFEPWPNPVGGLAHLRFSLSKEGPARLSIYDLRGRRVMTLVDGDMTAGVHGFDWESRDLAAGIYLISLQTRGSMLTRKLVMLR